MKVLTGRLRRLCFWSTIWILPPTPKWLNPSLFCYRNWKGCDPQTNMTPNCLKYLILQKKSDFVLHNCNTRIKAFISDSFLFEHIKSTYLIQDLKNQNSQIMISEIANKTHLELLSYCRSMNSKVWFSEKRFPAEIQIWSTFGPRVRCWRRSFGRKWQREKTEWEKRTERRKVEVSATVKRRNTIWCRELKFSRLHNRQTTKEEIQTFEMLTPLL